MGVKNFLSAMMGSQPESRQDSRSSSPASSYSASFDTSFVPNRGMTTVTTVTSASPKTRSRSLTKTRRSPNSSTMSSSPSPHPRKPALHVQIPLYIYPTNESWQPLLQAVSRHPNLHFDVIVNPANGPGPSLPDANYTAQLSRLNSFTNVTLYGYVHVSWAKRDLEAVLNDIRIYEIWNTASTKSPAPRQRAFQTRDSGLGLDEKVLPEAPAPHSAPVSLNRGGTDIHIGGIFVDEAPSHLQALTYMSALYTTIRNTLTRGTSVWTNPGTAVAGNFYAYADRITAFEDTYAKWKDGQGLLANFDAGRAERKKTGVMVHSCPVDKMENVLRRVEEEGFEGVFVTEGKGYQAFGRGWERWLDALDQGRWRA